MKNIIFEHLKEDIALVCRDNQTTALNINFWKTRGNNLKNLVIILQVEIHFHPRHPGAVKDAR